eukprot:TRINITY_DN3781_c2_g1_i1.p1 TRINITY_DN3781_c2_g1~~TRINITY_DN3781_c2_g1_i1.p1  ORF type:complete len:511 (+),score=162.61 TRINITY_DN3781_c2_g1_i1:101-1534(+)
MLRALLLLAAGAGAGAGVARSPGELAAALDAAARPSPIRLAPGLYGPLRLTAAHAGLTIEGPEEGEAPVLGAVVVTGAAGVTLRRLRLSSVAARGAHSLEVDNCTVTGGVTVDGGRGHRVHHSRVTNPGGGHCVWIASCGNLSTTPWEFCDTKIDNNVISECWSPQGPGDAGVLLGCTVGVEVLNNHIFHTHSWGVRINDNNYCPSILNKVRLNRIEDYGLGIGGEGACMYTYGHWFSPGNLLEFNHCRNGKICMYLDDASSGQTFNGNICENVTGTIMKVNGGHANTITGSMLLASGNPGGLTCRGLGWTCPVPVNSTVDYSCANMFAPNGTDGRWGKILRGVNYDQPPWVTYWPWYKGWCDYTSFRGKSCDPDHKGYDCFAEPTMNNISATAFVMALRPTPPSWAPCRDAPVNCCPHVVCDEHWNGNGTAARYPGDPGFADYAKGDLTLRNDSAVFRDLPGFPHVPFRSIGPQPA